MAQCDICGGFTLGHYNICAMCATSKSTQGIGYQYVFAEVADPMAPAIVDPPSYQARNTIENTAGGLGGYLEDWAENMRNWLTGMDYWSADQATHPGQQHTPHNCTEGTRSLDFQGIRAGQLGGTFWIDIQAQAGVAPNRNTHAQVLILCTGYPVDADRIQQALEGSLGEQRRALLHTADIGLPQSPP